MSKDQFFLMRAEQMATLYDSTFSKKDAKITGENLVQTILDEGNVDLLEFTANLARLNEVISSAMAKVRENLPNEKINVLGVEFTPVNGGNTVNYSEDEIYNELKRDLEARVDLLKLAQKQEVADLYGSLVPKVSTTPRKSSVTIKF